MNIEEFKTAISDGSIKGRVLLVADSPNVDIEALAKEHGIEIVTSSEAADLQGVRSGISRTMDIINTMEALPNIQCNYFDEQPRQAWKTRKGKNGWK